MRLIVETGKDIGREFHLTKAITSLGRSPDNDIVLDDVQVSRHHAQIWRQEDDFVVADLNSANGTFVNAVRLHAPQVLRHGDRLRLGGTTFSFQAMPEVKRPAARWKTSPVPMMLAAGAAILLILVLLFALTPWRTTGPAVTPSSPADLTAKQVRVQWRRADRTSDVQVDQHIPIQVGDQVTVDRIGRALLSFSQDRLVVELFRRADTIVREARREADGSIFVRLRQAFGTNRYRLQELAQARVTVETTWATIRAIGTEFLVSYDETQVTWVVTLEGEVEIVAQGQRVIVRAGWAAWVEPARPPQVPICADRIDVNRWLQEMRGTGETIPLGSIFLGWPQMPCLVATPTTPAAPISIPTFTPVRIVTSTPIATVTATRMATPTPTATRAATVTPSPTPAPRIARFAPDRAVLQACECTTLRWDVESVIAVYLDGERVVDHGSRQVCLQQTRTYKLRAVTHTGDLERSATVQVLYPTVNFRADRTTLAAGECTTLRWDVENVKELYLDGEGVVGHDSRRVCPTANQTFTLRVVTACGDQVHQLIATVALPDLAVDVDSFVETTVAYQPAIRVTISNIGAGTVSGQSIRIQYFVGDYGYPGSGRLAIDERRTISLSPGQYIRYIPEPRLTAYSGANIRVVVDVDNDVAESNEGNNEVAKDFYW